MLRASVVEVGRPVIKSPLELWLDVLLTVGAQLGTSSIAIVEVAIVLREAVSWLHTEAVSITVPTISSAVAVAVAMAMAGVSCVRRRGQMAITMGVPRGQSRAVAACVEALAAVEVGSVESVVLGVGFRRVLGSVLGSWVVVVVGVVSSQREASLERVRIDAKDGVPMRARVSQAMSTIAADSLAMAVRIKPAKLL